MRQIEKRVVKRRPILIKMLVPMLVLILIEIIILTGSVFGRGVISELEGSEKAIVSEKVSSRRNYLENEIVNSWMNLQYTSEFITSKAEKLQEEGAVSTGSLDQGSDSCLPLLEEISDELISLMRTNHVTGAFVVFNNEDLSQSEESGQYHNKPGIYLRDEDPTSQVSFRNQDLLIERAPVDLVNTLGIATDTTWSPMFEFGDKEVMYYDYLYKPYQFAYENGSKYQTMDMGYWGKPTQLFEEGKEVITFSVPLQMGDGSVYGVLGIDITLDYLQTMLPYSELSDDDKGSYVLAVENEKTGEWENILVNGPLYEQELSTSYKDQEDENKYYTCVEYLNIYNNNAPFSADKWALVSKVPTSDIFAFARKVEFTLLAASFITLLIGMGGSILIGVKVSKPVMRLSGEIQKKDPAERITLRDTGITEIDQMADAIEKLSLDVLESGRKFNQIIEMASVKLAGFQIGIHDRSLFTTEHFFDIFCSGEINERGMDAEEFANCLQKFNQYFFEQDEMTGSYIYKIPDGREYRFVRLKYVENEQICYGLAEDVTSSLLEKRILQHERDHDSLTSLYNRRAFHRKIRELFNEESNIIGIGVLIMLDLDNLKYINDTYGHDYGDRYIVKAASIIRSGLPERAVAARISGDEFNIFLYGFKDELEAREHIQSLHREFNRASVKLPEGKSQKVCISGGVAWFPKDSNSFDTLQTYADFAMYMVKNSVKGEIMDFDPNRYNSKESILQSKAALTELIENKAIRYAFQPIADAHTGKILAYEALMRSELPIFKSVPEILEVARQEGKLNQIEQLTWFQAMETFIRQQMEGMVESDTLLFINSVPNQRMTEEKEDEFAQRYFGYLGRIVMELTEDEQVQKDIWDIKRRKLKEWGCKIALDDYGTGYNGQESLITVSPDYIKVDIAIVREIHKNTDKQAVMEYIVNYAHGRGKYIIAEGVETREETETVIWLGADFLQGYYIAKPNFVPPIISEEAKSTIEEMSERMRNCNS